MLFVNAQGKALSVQQVRKWIKTLAQHFKLNPKDFSSHSLHSGGSSWFIAQGVSIVAIEKLGRWTCNSLALRRCYLKWTQEQAAKIAASQAFSFSTC